MLKKILVILGIMVLIMSVVGCQNKTTSVEKEVNDKVSQEISEEFAEQDKNNEDSINVESEKTEGTDEKDLKYLNVISEEQLEKVFPDKQIRDYAKKFLGQSAPNFEVKSLEGEVFDLESLKGKDFVLEFMATWCPACKASSPHIEEFKRLHPDKEVLVVSYTDTKEDILKYNEENDLTHSIHMTNISKEEFMSLYELKYVPSFFFIDKEGIIQFIYIGDMTTELVEALYEGSFGVSE